MAYYVLHHFSLLISAGNVLMLSEGRSGIDNVFSLQEGKASDAIYPSVTG
jgi:hypothetical protein